MGFLHGNITEGLYKGFIQLVLTCILRTSKLTSPDRHHAVKSETVRLVFRVIFTATSRLLLITILNHSNFATRNSSSMSVQRVRRERRGKRIEQMRERRVSSTGGVIRGR